MFNEGTPTDSNKELANAIKNLISNPNVKKQIKGVAKFLTLSVLIIILGFGILGSFNIANFNMDNYVLFLNKFIWILSPLIISIGAGAVASNINKTNENKEEEK